MHPFDHYWSACEAVLLCAPTSSGSWRLELSVGQWGWEDGGLKCKSNPFLLPCLRQEEGGGKLRIVVCFGGWNGLSPEGEGNLLCGILPIDGSGDDASSETSTFTCWVEPRDEGMGVGHPITRDAHRGGGA